MEPIIDPRIALAMAAAEVPLPEAPAASNVDVEKWHEYLGALEKVFDPSLFEDESDEGESSVLQTIQAEDGNDLELYFDVPPGLQEMKQRITDCSAVAHSSSTSGESLRKEMNCLVFLHGGGMAVASCNAPPYVNFRRRVAEIGVLVVSVNYRNSSGVLGRHPYPAGLRDCYSALQWIHQQREDGGCLETVRKVMVFGDSGGGNLSLAVCLLAKQRDELHLIDGVYSMCPYISNLYATARQVSVSSAAAPQSEWMPHSLTEMTQYMDLGMLQAMAQVYDGADSKDPIAWPYWSAIAALMSAKNADRNAATIDIFDGLPPHTISVNELDPLRDEGIIYYRALLHAGVNNVRCITVQGTTHAAEIIYAPDATPDIFHALLHDIISMFELI